MPDLTIPRGSLEYVEFELTDRQGQDLTDDVIELAIDTGGERTWLPAMWETGYARTVDPVLFDATYSISAHEVWARVVDSPEVPIVRLGYIRIVR